MRLPSRSPEADGRDGAGPRHRRAASGSAATRPRGGADLHGRPRRQQRGGGGRHRPPRHADQRLADDSSFPELFDLLRREREAWGARVIPWRNLREIFGVLRRREMLALLDRLGLSRRRHPGPAVRGLDGAAGRSGDARRQDRLAHPAGHRSGASPTTPSRSSWAEPDRGGLLATRPSCSGRPRRWPTRSRRPSAAAPEQWYSFKPIWPADRRGGRRPGAAGGADAGRHRRTPGPAARSAASRPRAAVTGLVPRAAGPGPDRGLVAGLPPARAARSSGSPSSPATLWYRATPERAAQARRNLRRVADWLRRGRARAAPSVRARRRPTRAPSSGSSGGPTGTPRATTSRWPAHRRMRADATSTSGSSIETPEVVAEAFAGGARRASSACTSGRIELPGAVPGQPGRRRRRADGDHRRPGAAGLVRAHARRGRASASSGCARRAARCSPPCATGPASGSSAIAT